MNVSYRPATVGDAEAMGRARAAGGWTGGAAAPVLARYMAGEHHPQQALAPRATFVAEETGAIIGFVAGHLTRRFGRDGELQWLYVLPAFRGTAVADMLLGRMASWYTAQGARRVCVNVAPDNGRARAFYAQHGAHAVSEYWLEWSDIGTALAGTRERTRPAV